MALVRTEIVRELEDKVRCPSCGSYWMDPVILGRDDWLIDALGLCPCEPAANTAAALRERVGCRSCGRDAAIDVSGVVRALGDLEGQDSLAFERLVGFKRELMGALVRGDAVDTPFGLFFVHARAPRLVRSDSGAGYVQLAARRGPQFLPKESFILEVTRRPVHEAQIRACMERDVVGGFLDVEREAFCDVATGIRVPEPTRRLDAVGLFDDVVADLLRARSSPLRGLGAFVLRRVGRRQSPKELVEFSFWPGFVHVLQGAS